MSLLAAPRVGVGSLYKNHVKTHSSSHTFSIEVQLSRWSYGTPRSMCQDHKEYGERISSLRSTGKARKIRFQSERTKTLFLRHAKGVAMWLTMPRDGKLALFESQLLRHTGRNSSDIACAIGTCL